jgi:hypothetical protein
LVCRSTLNPDRRANSEIICGWLFRFSNFTPEISRRSIVFSLPVDCEAWRLEILRHLQLLCLPNEALLDALPHMHHVLVKKTKFYLAFALIVAAAGELRAQGFLIPDTTRRDMVFDFAGQNFYISTSTGLIKTFHLSSRTFGTTYNLGGSLNGIDIARNDSFILAAQNNIGASEGTFQKVNLATGMITNINYMREFGEEGAWDVAVGSNGLALATTRFGGSGWTPLRQIDLSTNAITIRTDVPGSGGPGQVSAPTQIHRSADGTRFFFMEGNISSGPLFTYSAITNSFGPRFEGNGYLDSASGAVNRNGHLIALRQNGPTAASLNTAPNFNFLHSFNELDSGVAFDAVHDSLYGVNSETDEIIAYNTNTFAELFRFPIGEDIPTVPPATQFHTGTLVASADGHWIALETDSGIRLFHLPPGSQLGNISTRAFVQTGDNVMIGGFIVQGNQSKRVIIRAIGPELTQYGVPDPLANPTLELHDGTGALIAANDNWVRTIIGGIITSDQVRDIRNSGYAPGDRRESAIIADLPPGNYTAIVRGVNDMTGVGLVEVYDLAPDTNSILGNISTRAFAQTADNVMIGGFIVQGSQPKRLIVRAIGPELGAPPYNIPNPLADPTLELHDETGELIASNNDWRHTIIGGIITSDQVRDILRSGYAPGDLLESAIIAELPPGNYTAIVRGVNDTTGVALVEVYDLHQ